MEEDETTTKTPTQVPVSQTLTSIKRPEYSPRESNERKMPELNTAQQNLNPSKSPPRTETTDALLVSWLSSQMEQFRSSRPTEKILSQIEIHYKIP